MKNNVVFLGTTANYTYQFSATNSKTEFMARGLVEDGSVCSVLNGVIGYSNINGKVCIEKVGIGKVFTYRKYGSQLISWLFNIRNLYLDLKNLRKVDCKNIIVLEFPDYHIYLLYILFAKWLGYKTVTISHEWGPTVKSIHWLRWPSIWIYTKTFGYLTNGILPISEYIVKRISHFNKPYLKLPIMADFSIQSNGVESKEHYFLYCVYAAYQRVITEVIDAYSKYLNQGGDYKLILVLSGNNKQIGAIKKHVLEMKLNNKIEIKSKVPYIELISLYEKASALVIPLDPSHEQDEARFSQKIAEYLSSKTVVISNNVGEIKYYFKDKKNIVLCSYDTSGFANAFKWVSTHPEESMAIGKEGYELGVEEFNYKTWGVRLNQFFSEL